MPSRLLKSPLTLSLSKGAAWFDRLTMSGTRSFRSAIPRLSILVALAALVVVPLAQAMLASAEEHRTEAAQGRNLALLAGFGQDTDVATAFFPQTVRIRAGDTLTWTVGSDEPHTVTFLSGSPMPPFFVPAPTGSPAELLFNPQVAFPTRHPGEPVETYGGTGYVNSGLMDRNPLPPLPGLEFLADLPPNDTLALTFDTPGAFAYMCLFHGQVMQGFVEVLPAGATDVDTQESMDAVAAAEIARFVDRLAAAREQAQTARREPGPGGTSLVFVKAGTRDIISEMGAEILDFFPKNVTIKAGDTVVWSSTAFHTVTFVPTPPPPFPLIFDFKPDAPPSIFFNPVVANPSKPSATFDPTRYFNSADIGPFSTGGTAWALTFDRPGSFDYICALHVQFGMTGTITVEPR